MITQIRKRNGSTEQFQQEKITWAIFKAVTAVGGDDFDTAQKISNEVVDIANLQLKADEADVEQIQDIVERC